MSASFLQVIRDEHQALSAMLRSISLLLQHEQQHKTAPDFSVLRAMLFYIDEFPERLHHRKETELLFPLIRARCPEVADVLDRLDHDHGQGEQAIRNLEHALLAYEQMGESRRAAFEQALARYQGFYLSHMRVEEEQILPLALKVLTPAEQTQLDQAFAANRDPFTGHAAEAEYAQLFSRIVNSAPAPIGLG